jgi:hypothetical protein
VSEGTKRVPVVHVALVALSIVGGVGFVAVQANAPPSRVCELAHVPPALAGLEPNLEKVREEYESDCGSRQQPGMTAYNRCCERMRQLNIQIDAQRAQQIDAQRAQVQRATTVATTPERRRGFPVLNGSQPACLTEEALDELLKAIVEQDQVVVQDLERRHVCLMPRAGTRVSILEGVFTVKVRAITSQGSLVLWVPGEALGYE